MAASRAISGIAKQAMKWLRYRLVILCAAFCALLPQRAAAQFYSFGTDPSSLSWRKLESGNYTLIYPSRADSLARVYMNALESARVQVNDAMRISPRPIPVVLHPYTVFSNGAVSWAPKVVNLITMPDAIDPLPTPWPDDLVKHELRHVAQVEHYTKGPYRTFYWLIGEQVTGLGLGLFANRMLMEGDAVLAETILSESGRGRNARFLSYMRSLYLEGKFDSWERAAFGSFHRQTIDKYAVGYTIMASEMLRTANYEQPGLFFEAKGGGIYDIKRIFSRKLRSAFPSKTQMLEFSQGLFSEVWRQDFAARPRFTQQDTLSPYSRFYTIYSSPVAIDLDGSGLDGTVVVRKRGIENAGEIVALDTLGRERHLAYTGSVVSKMSAPAGGRLYWSEASMNGTASLESFSEIRYLDLYTLKTGFVGARSNRYFNPVPAPGGGYLAVTEYLPEGESKLRIIDIGSGYVTASADAPAGGQIVEAAFYGGNIYCTVIEEGGESIWAIPCSSLIHSGAVSGAEPSAAFSAVSGAASSAASGGAAETPFGTASGKTSGDSLQEEWRRVCGPYHLSIEGLRSGSEGLYFMSDLDGVMNIYGYYPEYDSLEQLVNSPFGADSPYYAKGRTLIYAAHGSGGAPLVKTEEPLLGCDKVSFEDRRDDPVVAALARITDAESRFNPDSLRLCDYSDTVAFPSRPYRKYLNFLHFHSWAPLYYNIDKIQAFSGNWYDMAAPGLTLYSQNHLGNVVSMVGVSYHDRRVAGHAKIAAYAAGLNWELEAGLNDQPRLLYPSSKDEEPEIAGGPSLKASLTVDYPLNLYGAGWNRGFVPILQLSYVNHIYTSPSEERFHKRNATVGLNYYRLRPKATNAMFPRLGYSVSAYGRKAFTGNDNFGASSLYLAGYGYLPGPLSGHGLKIGGGYERNFGPGRVSSLTTMATMPRGIDLRNNAPHFARLYIDYGMPIWLGDKAFSGILYLKRLRLTPFADYSMSWGEKRTVMGSLGSDAMFDFNLFRLGISLSAGLRYARVEPFTENGRNYFTLLFGFDI